MGGLRARSAAATLLLAALAVGGLVADGHGHDVLAIGSGHSDLPTFETGHSRPDRTLHVEDATAVATSPCIGCLLRHPPRVKASLRMALGIAEPCGRASIVGPDRRSSVDVCQLPASRAPPRV